MLNSFKSNSQPFIFLLLRILYSSMPHFLIGLFVFWMFSLVLVLCMFWILTIWQMDSGQDFSSFCRLPHPNSGIPCWTVIFLVSCGPMSVVGLNAYTIRILFRNPFPVPISSHVFPTFCSIRCRVPCLTLKFLIYLEFSFMRMRNKKWVVSIYM